MRRYLALILLFAVLLFQTAAASEEMHVEAKGAVLIDGKSGRVLFAQNADEMLPEASCTKIMTALLALENSSLDEMVATGPNAHGVSGTSIYLSEGESLTMEQMLYGLMLRSGNDAAVAIAEHVAGSVSEFAAMANQRAQELNADAHFVNPHGLDADGHKASALGLARIMQAAMRNEDFRTITSTQKKIIPWVGNEYSRVLENKNRLLSSYDGATGGKTGYTSRAGRCLVFSAKREGMELIGVVLNCYTWFDVAAEMLDYGFDRYRLETALSEGQQAAQVTVLNGNEASVHAVAAADLSGAVRKGGDVATQIETHALTAPVRKGEKIGVAILMDGDAEVDRCDLLAAENVDAWSIAAAIRNVFRNWALRFA